MKRVQGLFCAALVLALVGFCSELAFGQYGASLEGTVTDKSGAVVPGATVTITNWATGVSRNSVSGESGFYRITALAPGLYKVVVTAQSFKTSTTPSVPVGAEATNSANVVLEAGQVSESVTVIADSQVLDTENASIGGHHYFPTDCGPAAIRPRSLRVAAA